MMLQKTKVHGETVKVNGTVIYHEVRGDGPAILFIAGATGDAGTFGQVADLLANEYTVVTYDRRGNSRSPRPAGWAKTSIDEQADDAAALLQALDLAPAFVYGNSYGGVIALNLVIRYPDLVRSAILHEPAMFSVLARPAALPILPIIEREMAAGHPRRAVEAFLRFAIGDANFEGMDEQWRERLLGNGETLFGFEFGTFEAYRPDDSALASVKVPVQVLAGAEGAPVFHEVAEWLAARLHVQAATMPGAHAPQRDRPQEVVDTIRPFLRRVSTG
jgi:pimeloyl-ACP methyl ester carboxylesterase